MKSPYLIIGNFSNRTVALIQWAFEHKLHDVSIISIDTGWSNEFWNNRVQQIKNHIINNYNFKFIKLKSKLSFQEIVKDRQAFPSQKYQWCAYFLKGMTINTWLDQNDLDGKMVLLLPKISSDEVHNPLVKEFIESSEYYGYRKIWHPLWPCNEDEIDSLVARSGIPAINFQSQECSPCVHSNNSEILNLSCKNINRLSVLEKEVGKSMFADRFNNIRDNRIESIVKLMKTDKNTHREKPKRGCANNWACRL